MDVNKNIRDVIHSFVDSRLSKERYYLEVGIVKTVEESSKTFEFEPVGGDSESEVNMSVFGSENYIVPEVGSIVLVGYTDKSEKYCLHVEKADKVIFADGNNGGLINISDQVTKLNELVIKVNALYNLLKTWTVVPSDGGAALKAAALLLTNASTFNKSDFEDIKFTH